VKRKRWGKEERERGRGVDREGGRERGMNAPYRYTCGGSNDPLTINFDG